MTAVLVYTDLAKGKPKAVSQQIMGQLQDGHTVDVAVIGELSDEGLAILKKAGAQKVHVLGGDKLKSYTPEGYAAALKDLATAGKYEYVFTGASTNTKDFFPRLAALLNSPIVSDATGISFEGNELKVIKPLFAGKCLAKLHMEGSKPHIVIVRPNSLEMKAVAKEGAGEKVTTSPDVGVLRAIVKEVIKGASEKIDLTEANIIVSGGRGMKNGENYSILYKMAEVLGAAVGASRAAVDAGFVPYEMQVGQTGKTVSPTLYIACGISGAIQHLAGMRTSKVIVAINTDPNAPIFSKADYGIVGDLFEIVPIMTEELKKILEH
jgi:electron transfer flavoprotein alpha subunit